MTDLGSDAYPTLFSEYDLRGTRVRNRVVFAPTCPTWVDNPYEGRFTDQAVAYYEERARAGLGLIIIGGTLVSRDTLYTPLLFPGLWEDSQIDGLRAIADAVHAHGCKLAIQLLHVGMRSVTVMKTDSRYDPDATWYMAGPSQVPPAEYPGAPMPKEMEEHEIEQALADFEAAAGRARQAGVDGVELHLAHGYLPWQFLSPLYNQRTDGWGGSYEKRLRFPLEALKRTRAGVGSDAFLGYRINSTSFQDGDLEIEDVTKIVADIDEQADIDYVSLSAGVHHSFIHTPMTYEQGWEREYTRAVKAVTDTPVMLVGRYQTPAPMEEALTAGDADFVLLARQMFADGEWVAKVRSGNEEDIRRCVAANFCWRSVTRGQRVTCVYNPTVGREAIWGAGTLTASERPRRVLVIGAGPAGLEYARVAAARGHEIVVLERASEPGGHTRAYGALPHRTEYARIGSWLADQAAKNGAQIRTGVDVTSTTIRALLDEIGPEQVVVATGARSRRDGFQGQTGRPLPGHETANCASWEDVALDRIDVRGNVLIIDELQDVAAPLTAVKLAESGASVTLMTRWPTVAMDTAPDVYMHWMLTYLYKADVAVVTDHFTVQIDGPRVIAVNVYDSERTRAIEADWIVMATARTSENALYHALRDEGVPVEMIGDAVAPRGAWEATFEGHRAARRLDAPS